MSKQTEALKLALEALEETLRTLDDENAKPGGSISDTIWYSEHETLFDYLGAQIATIREALADSALDRMADNARELGLDYEPPCKTGSQCTSKCQQCEQPAQPSKPWVGLTEDEVAVMMMEAWGCASIAPRHAPAFARAIEAKLREKNA